MLEVEKEDTEELRQKYKVLTQDINVRVPMGWLRAWAGCRGKVWPRHGPFSPSRGPKPGSLLQHPPSSHQTAAVEWEAFLVFRVVGWCVSCIAQCFSLGLQCDLWGSPWVLQLTFQRQLKVCRSPRLFCLPAAIQHRLFFPLRSLVQPLPALLCYHQRALTPGSCLSGFICGKSLPASFFHCSAGVHYATANCGRILMSHSVSLKGNSENSATKKQARNAL